MLKKNFWRRAAAIVTAAVMTASALPFYAYAAMNTSEFQSSYTYPTEMRGLTAFQIVNDMGAGWNLGNSLESENREDHWGNPITTKAMIDDIAEKGFTTLRVPVRWDDNYSDPSTYTIKSDYMDRVETVVNYGLANDMYVILNVHHNDLQHNVPDTNAISAELSAVWTQIGERFKNYGDKLIFEVNNEPRSGNDWTGNATYYKSVNESNEAARAAIRSTGGNNEERLVMLPTYCASGDYAKAVAWTKNANDDMIAVSIHAYLPYDFAFEGSGHTNWTEADELELESFFDRMKSIFLDKGIPVIIGEFGTRYKHVDNTADREKHAAVYGDLARQFAQQDIPCVWWDNNCFTTNGENFGIYDRWQQTFIYGGIADALISAYKGDPICETSTGGDEILANGGNCDSWGQAVSFDAATVVMLAENDTIYCDYTSSAAPEFIMQSFTNDSKGWVKASPDYCANGVAQWKRSSLLNRFGGTFDDLGKVYIGAQAASLSVSKVYVPRTSAHTHSYNGTETVVIPATSTTNGRKTTACSVSGCSAVKITVTDPIAANSKPIITVTAGAGQVNIKWNPVDNATNYIVYHYLNGKYTKLGTTTNTSFTATGLTGGTRYGFLVQAYVNGAWTKFTADDIKYATPAAAEKPVITVTAGAAQVDIKWDVVNNATNYIVYYYLNGKYTKLGTTTNTSFTATGLTGGTRYGFLVQAYVNGAWTKFTADDIKYATPVAAAKPVISSLTAGDSTMTIKWSGVDNATNYIVYYYLDGKYTKLGTTTANSFTATKLTNGNRYGFLVQAYVNGAWTKFTSADIKYATPMTAAKPAITSLNTGDRSVTFTWSKVNNASTYIVYHYLNGKYTKLGTTTGTSFAATNLSNGTNYGFLVQAYVNGAWTKFTAYDIRYATPSASKPVITVTAGANKVDIKWNSVNNATNYIVYYYLNGKYTKLGTTTNTSFTATNLIAGTKYGFLVQAYVNGSWTKFTAEDIKYVSING